VLGGAGFVGARIITLFDCFAATSKERVARKFGVQGANLLATKAR
jgi:hypothetical protein